MHLCNSKIHSLSPPMLHTEQNDVSSAANYSALFIAICMPKRDPSTDKPFNRAKI
ncbi:hypothetical protein Bbad01_04830 [Bacillus badius]|nr:hypothetical protein Bbad01_04830 [Bacillus badius]